MLFLGGNVIKYLLSDDIDVNVCSSMRKVQTFECKHVLLVRVNLGFGA